jgi:DNA-binding NtrC family response regulator
MSEKQKAVETEKNDIQMPGLNLSKVLQYLNDIGLQSPQQNHPRKKDKKDVLEFFIENVFMNDSINFKEFIEDIEQAILIKTLAKFNGNQRETAKFLGIKYTTLHEKVKRYNINFRKEPVIDFYRTNIPES